MNSPLISPSVLPAARFCLGTVLLIALAGCAHAPLRQQSSASDVVSALDPPANVIPPRPIQTFEPPYPYEMSSRELIGWVRLRCLVDEDGAVHDIAVQDPSGLDLPFQQAAIAALKQWTFAPGLRDGQPAPMRVVIPFQFRLLPDSPRYRQ